MSRQEEDKKNSGSSGKALAVGLAATALGVGIGTALYYFFNKDEENNDAGPSAEWRHEEAFHQTYKNDNDDSDSYSTISANTTSDTSIYDDQTSSPLSSNTSSPYNSNSSHSNDSFYLDASTDFQTANVQAASNTTINSSIDSDSEWDVTNTLEVPHDSRQNRSPIGHLVDTVITNRSAWLRRKNVHRRRSDTLEECSICFEVMLKDEELLGLPCTHNFHVKCISPWLHQHQTCPVCRANAD